ELLDLLLQLRLTPLRLLRDPLAPALDVVAVGDEQLQLPRLGVVVGPARPRAAVEHPAQPVDRPLAAEPPTAGAAHPRAAHRRRSCRGSSRRRRSGSWRRTSASAPAAARARASRSARASTGARSTASPRAPPTAPRCRGSRARPPPAASGGASGSGPSTGCAR